MSKANKPAEIDVPWGAWYRDTMHRLRLPGHWSVDVLAPVDPPSWTGQQITDAIDSPIESRPLEELSRGCKSACLVVDDLARPTRAGDLLPALVERISRGGIGPDHIRVVIATGTHGGLDRRQIEWKVGSRIAELLRVEVHDGASALGPTGIQYGKDELMINRTFLEAELKLGVSSVLPHSFAGYSGGAKLMLPGLAHVKATARSHQFVQMGLRGGADPNENRFRLETEQLARELGFEWTVCVVPNRRREAAGVFAGDLVAAHRAACRRAAEVYATPAHATYDCVVLNAFPKDTDLIQAENALVALKTANNPVVREEGVILITTAASEGLGRHGLFAPGGVSYRPPRRKRALGQREIWLYSPSVTQQEVRALYWSGYPFFDQRDKLHDALAKKFSGPTHAAVLPAAPMQQLRDVRS